MSGEGDLTQAERNRDLGRRVKAARAYRNKTQTDLADLLGVKRQAVADYENGKVNREVTREGFLSKAAELTDLPRQFFAIDFNDLPVMVTMWRKVSHLPTDSELRKLLDEIPNPDPPPE